MFELSWSIMATVHMITIHDGVDMIYVAVIAFSLSWRDQPSMVGQHVEIATNVVDDHGLGRLSCSWSHEPLWFMR